MVGITSPNSQALKNACRDVAEENWGFVYAKERKVQNKINDIYAESDRIGLTDASEVTEEDIKNILDDLTETEECQEGVYFINPFGMQEFDKESLIGRLENIFKRTPFVTEEQLKDKIEGKNTSEGGESVAISDDDIHYLIRELRNRNYIEEGFSSPAHTYYRAGNDLKSHRLVGNIRGINSQLEGEANNGKISKKEIQSVLGIQTDDRIISELRGESILDLGTEESGPYVVNTPSCKEDYVKSQVDKRFVGAIESELEESNYVLQKSDFEEKLLDEFEERSNFLGVVPAGEDELITDYLEEKIKQRSEHDIEITTPTDDDAPEAECVICADELDSFYEEEAKNIIQDVADGSPPGSDKPFIENDVTSEVENKNYNHNEKINEYLQEMVKERCREIAREESIPEIISNG